MKREQLESLTLDNRYFFTSFKNILAFMETMAGYGQYRVLVSVPNGKVDGWRRKLQEQGFGASTRPSYSAWTVLEISWEDY